MENPVDKKMQNSMPDKNTKDYFRLSISIIILILLSILWFKPSIPWTDRENNIFQLALGVVLLFIGTFIGSIVSSKENKSFATSAYRRIMDIEKVLERQKRYLDVLIQKKSILESDIQVLIELNYSLEVTVQSSKLDWTDQIGDVIKITDQIKDLKEKASSYENVDNTRYMELSTQINDLKENLPFIIQSGINNPNEPRSPVFNSLVDQYYSDIGQFSKTIRFSVRSVNSEEDIVKVLKSHPPLLVQADVGMHKHWINIQTPDFHLGIIESPFTNLTVKDNDFSVTFYSILHNYAEETNPHFREAYDQTQMVELNQYEYSLDGEKLQIVLPVDLEKYPGSFAKG